MFLFKDLEKSDWARERDVRKERDRKRNEKRVISHRERERGERRGESWCMKSESTSSVRESEDKQPVVVEN